MSVQGYQEIIQGPLAQYVAASQQIGEDVAAQSKMVEKAFNVQLEYLVNASKSAPPSAADEKHLILPIGQCIWKIQDFREKNVRSKYFNHLSAISESIPALNWVAVSPAPASYVKEMKNVAQMYTNRVLKDRKEEDRKHMDWAKEWIQTLTALQAFVKQHHTTGLVWGGLKRVTSEIQARKHTTLRQGPASVKVAQSSIQLGAKAGSAFAQVDQGENATKSFKKVTSDMQTHKHTTLHQGPASMKVAQSSIQLGAKAGSDTDRSEFAQIDQGENVTMSLKKATSEIQTHKHTSLHQGPASIKVAQSSIQLGAKAGSDTDRSAFAQIDQGENVTKSIKKATSEIQTHKHTSLHQGPASIKAPQSSMQLGAKAGSATDRSAFAKIDQGENVTKSVKKVTSDMQTHMRQGPAPFKAPQSSIQPGAEAHVDKPARFIHVGKRWLIEHQKNNHNLLVEGADMHNAVYLYKCTNCTIVVKGRISAIILDSCKKTSVVFDSLLSCIEFINCQSVQMQVIAKVPTISIVRTDGCQMYLSEESLEVEIVTSKSSGMNVLFPKPDGDYVECPVPEQFKTTIVPGEGLNTIIFENQG